jgi:hypothetical protein
MDRQKKETSERKALLGLSVVAETDTAAIEGGMADKHKGSRQREVSTFNLHLTCRDSRVPAFSAAFKANPNATCFMREWMYLCKQLAVGQ